MFINNHHNDHHVHNLVGLWFLPIAELQWLEHTNCSAHILSKTGQILQRTFDKFQMIFSCSHNYHSFRLLNMYQRITSRMACDCEEINKHWWDQLRQDGTTHLVLFNMIMHCSLVSRLHNPTGHNQLLTTWDNWPP